MTLSWPTSRNSFHPAWLLLPLPPLIALIFDSFSAAPQHPAQVLRFLLSGMVLFPLVWWRASPANERARRMLKELRLQLPGLLVAVLVPGLLALGGDHDLVGFMAFAYGFGCLLMGAASFGNEFEQRTLAGLLAQPKSRAALYAEKVGVLTILLILATANLLLLLPTFTSANFEWHDGFEMSLVALFALAGGPLYSLLSRSTLAGLVFNVSIPPILCLAGTGLLQVAYRIINPGIPLPDEWTSWSLAVGVPVYLLSAFFLSWRQFRGLQLREGSGAGQADTRLHPLSRPLDLLLSRWLTDPGPTTRLIRKELRLQVLPWLVAAITVGLWLLWWAVRLVTPVSEEPGILDQVSGVALMAGLLGALTLVGTGSACVAEERELGTLEWQLTQPASLARQWWVKLGVTTFLSLGLGVILPGLLLLICFGPEELRAGSPEQPPWVALPYIASILLLLVVSIYASSISRNTMKAAAAAVGIGFGIAGIVGLCGYFVSQQLDYRITFERDSMNSALQTLAPRWVPSENFMMILAGFLSGGLVLLGLSFLLSMAARNSRRLVVSSSQIGRQLGALSLGLLLLVTASGMGLVQLALLQNQARFADLRAELRDSLIVNLGRHFHSGRLIPEIFEHFGVVTNASPEVLAEAMITARGVSLALSDVNQLFRSSSPGENLALALRYGLIDPTTDTNVFPTAPQPQPFVPLSPELQLRYGLDPTRPAPK